MLMFRKEYAVTLENLESQADIRKKQIELSVTYYDGEENVPENISDAFYPNNDEGIVFCISYEVTDEAGNHLYDFWNINSDSGTLFFAGTDKPAGIEMIQFYFDPTGIGVEQKSDLEVLAKELQTGFDLYIRENRHTV